MQNNVIYLDDFRPMKPLEDFAPQFGGPLPETFNGDFQPIKIKNRDWLALILYEAFGFVIFMTLIGLCFLLWFVLP